METFTHRFVLHSAQLRNAQSSSPPAPACLSPQTPAGASPHPHPPHHTQTAPRRPRRRKTPSAAGCWVQIGSSTRSTNTPSCKAPRRDWMTFSPRVARCSITSWTSAPCLRARSGAYVTQPTRSDSVETSSVGLIEEGTYPSPNSPSATNGWSVRPCVCLQYAGHVHLLGRCRLHILLLLSDMEISRLRFRFFTMHACCILSSGLTNHTFHLIPYRFESRNSPRLHVFACYSAHTPLPNSPVCLAGRLLITGTIHNSRRQFIQTS